MKTGTWINNSKIITAGRWQIAQDYVSAEHKARDGLSLWHNGKHIARLDVSKRKAIAMAKKLNS